MGNSQSSPYKLNINSNFDSIADARHWAAKHAARAGFDSEDIFSVELALGEALTNVIRHAYGGEPNHEIHLSLMIDDKKLRLRIVDFGRKFDPSDYAPPNLDSLREGGYGLYLIKEAMDEVIYDTSRPQGTQLDLIKYRPQNSRG